MKAYNKVINLMNKEEKTVADRPQNFMAEEAQPFFFEGGEHGVLLIHGFTGSAGHMRLIGEHLRDQGFTVMGINLPGHATSVDDMANYGWRDWLKASTDAYKELRARCKYVSVSGLSMGGVLTMILAEQADLTAAVPISAPMGVQNKAMAFAGPASLFMKRVAWGEDPERQKMLDSRYDHGYSGFPTRCAVDLSKLIRMARRNLEKTICPVLIVQSHADETITADSANVIAENVSSTRKEILWLEEVPHVCTISKEHEHIAECMAQFLRKAEK